MIPIEVGLRVSRTLPLWVEAIRHEVANHIRFSIDRAHPLVHVHPVALDSESITDTVRLIAAASNFFVSGIDVHEVDGVRHVELELEVDDRLSLTEAHDHATALERAIRAGGHRR